MTEREEELDLLQYVFRTRVDRLEKLTRKLLDEADVILADLELAMSRLKALQEPNAN